MKLKLMLVLAIAALVGLGSVTPAHAFTPVTYTVTFSDVSGDQFCDFMVLTLVNNVTPLVYGPTPTQKAYLTGYHDLITNCGESVNWNNIGYKGTLHGHTPPEWDLNGGHTTPGFTITDPEETGFPVLYEVDLANGIWANFFGEDDGNYYYYLEGFAGVSSGKRAVKTAATKATAPMRRK